MTNLVTYFQQAKASPLVDSKGQMHPTWQNYFQQLNTFFNQNISPEGLQAPLQNTTNINVLNNSKSLGKFVYNTDSNTLMVNLNGVFKTVQTM